MERITPLFTKPADPTSDEGSKLAKLKVLTPTDVYKYIAIVARYCKHIGELVQIVEAQLMDPFTGLAGGG
jgi:hypothetical protein